MRHFFTAFVLPLLLTGCSDTLSETLPQYEKGYPIFTTLEGEVDVIGSIPSHAVAGQTVRILLQNYPHQYYNASLNGEPLKEYTSPDSQWQVYYEFVMPAGEVNLRIVMHEVDIPYADDFE